MGGLPAGLSAGRQAGQDHGHGGWGARTPEGPPEGREGSRSRAGPAAGADQPAPREGPVHERRRHADVPGGAGLCQRRRHLPLGAVAAARRGRALRLARGPPRARLPGREPAAPERAAARAGAGLAQGAVAAAADERCPAQEVPALGRRNGQRRARLARHPGPAAAGGEPLAEAPDAGAAAADTQPPLRGRHGLPRPPAARDVRPREGEDHLGLLVQRRGLRHRRELPAAARGEALH
mmetsp:Transcript_81281/g.263257  ORF Transcript_81281/g.263257 Transcript_81281/m.263257 type:complete len:237 (+) Transcript_81281:94-804(+)